MQLRRCIKVQIHGHTDTLHGNIRDVERCVRDDSDGEERRGCEQDEERAEIGTQESWGEGEAEGREEDVLGSELALNV